MVSGYLCCLLFFFFSSRRRHTRSLCDWSSDVCSSDLIDRFPKASGGSDPTLSRELSRVLDRADGDAKSLGDAYVSTEHLLLALAEEKGATARQLLSANGVTRDRKSVV